MSASQKIRVLIIEDEEPARELIRHYLAGYDEIDERS